MLASSHAALWWVTLQMHRAVLKLGLKKDAAHPVKVRTSGKYGRTDVKLMHYACH